MGVVAKGLVGSDWRAVDVKAEGFLQLVPLSMVGVRLARSEKYSYE